MKFGELGWVHSRKSFHGKLLMRKPSTQFLEQCTLNQKLGFSVRKNYLAIAILCL